MFARRPYAAGIVCKPNLLPNKISVAGGVMQAMRLRISSKKKIADRWKKRDMIGGCPFAKTQKLVLGS